MLRLAGRRSYNNFQHGRSLKWRLKLQRKLPFTAVIGQFLSERSNVPMRAIVLLALTENVSQTRLSKSSPNSVQSCVNTVLRTWHPVHEASVESLETSKRGDNHRNVSHPHYSLQSASAPIIPQWAVVRPPETAPSPISSLFVVSFLFCVRLCHICHSSLSLLVIFWPRIRRLVCWTQIYVKSCRKWAHICLENFC